jgi:DNA-binding transcriptional regulator YiaG
MTSDEGRRLLEAMAEREKQARGGRPDTLNEQRAEEIRVLRDKGMSIRAIARAIGVAVSTLRDWIARRLLTRPKALPLLEHTETTPPRPRALPGRVAAVGVCPACGERRPLLGPFQVCADCERQLPAALFLGTCWKCKAPAAIVMRGYGDGPRQGLCARCKFAMFDAPREARQRRWLAEQRRRDTPDPRFVSSSLDTRYDPPRWIE